MHRIAARIVSVGAGLIISGCSVCIDFRGSPSPPNNSEITETKDLSGDYTVGLAARSSAADAENRQRAATARRRPERKPLTMATETPPAAPAQPEELGKAVPATLVGLDFDEVRHLLGAPDTAKDGHPVRIWQYADADCKIALHFYFDLKTERYRTLYVKTDPPPPSAGDTLKTADNAAPCRRSLRHRIVANGVS